MLAHPGVAAYRAWRELEAAPCRHSGVQIKETRIMQRISMTILLLCALASASADPDHAAVRKTLRALAPDASVESLRALPDSQLIEAVVDGNVVYVSVDGRYLVNGAVFDAHSGTDVAEARRSELRRELIAEVKRDERMLYAPEHTTHRVTVFTDIDCGYCRRLHEQIPAYNALGIAIDYRFLPRAGIGSKSHQKAAFAWCSDDPRGALDAAMAGHEATGPRCEDPIAEDFELARRLRLNGTPMLVTEKGELIPTYLPPEQLAARLRQP